MRDELKKRNLSSSGLRQDLIVRLSQIDKENESKTTNSSSSKITTTVNEKNSSPNSIVPKSAEGLNEMEMSSSDACNTFSSQETKSPPKNYSSPTENSQNRTLATKAELFEREKIGSNSPHRSILKSPKKKSPPMAPIRVLFSGVEVREYKRRAGGSCGLPHQGKFSLGLDWTYESVTCRTISEFEPDRSSANDVTRIPERVRKELLFSSSHSPPTNPEDQDLSLIRKSRKKIGCSCKGPSSPKTSKNSKPCCASNKCICFKNGIECMEDTCGCTDDTCKNPLRIKFDEDKINSFRKEKIMSSNK